MANDTSDLGRWDPLSPHEIGSLFTDFPGSWCIAGGWAIDLYAGVQSRPHDDIDILITRKSLPSVHAALPGWELYGASGVLTPWLPETPLAEGTHDIWCRETAPQGEGDLQDMPWRFQLMVVVTDAESWYFRRDDRIHGPLSEMTLERDGLPILAPEIQLLYKSRLPNRTKDEADFATIAPILEPHRRSWLAAAINLLYPPHHPWLENLGTASTSTSQASRTQHFKHI